MTPAAEGFAAEARTLLDAGRSEEAIAACLRALEIDPAFIDGLHLFEQALRDFIHIERHAAQRSVLLFHDCLPLNRLTASRTRATGFWTGDVWKIVPILKTRRPDLDVFVIPAYPTGLAVVTWLDPSSRALEENFDSIVSSFLEVPWDLEAAAPIVANDEASVLARLGRGR